MDDFKNFGDFDSPAKNYKKGYRHFTLCGSKSEGGIYVATCVGINDENCLSIAFKDNDGNHHHMISTPIVAMAVTTMTKDNWHDKYALIQTKSGSAYRFDHVENNPELIKALLGFDEIKGLIG